MAPFQDEFLPCDNLRFGGCDVKTFTFTDATLIKPDFYLKTEITALEQNDLGINGFPKCHVLKLHDIWCPPAAGRSLEGSD